jgi:hypothetical protein
MTEVTTKYQMLVVAGHHRQPRNANSILDLGGGSTNPYPPFWAYKPSFFPTLAYPPQNAVGFAELIFWTVTDGTISKVLPPEQITPVVGIKDLNITAWYYPTSGPLAGPPGPPSIFVDALSATTGNLIDDTFVDVTSDPTLTQTANVVGIVPTASAETLAAKAILDPITKRFRLWTLNEQLMPAGVNTLSLAAGTTGSAIAIYEHRPPGIVTIPRYPIYNPFWAIETHGGTGPDGPPDAVTEAIVELLLLAQTANFLSPRLKGEVLHLAEQQGLAVMEIVKAALRSIEDNSRG